MKSSSKFALLAVVGAVCGLLAAAGVVVEGDKASPPVSAGQAAPGGSTSPFHTPPGQWTEPRNCHRPFMKEFDDRFFFRRDVLLEDVQDRVLSPNKGYWYSIYMPDTNAVCAKDGIVYVHVERDYSLRVVFRAPAGPPKVNWINEKLLYVEVWWSEILGSYLILDVEQERPLVIEMIQNGRQAYEQAHGGTP